MINFNELPSQEYLKECLDYDEITGNFTWKLRPEHHFKTYGTFKQVNTQRAYKKAGFISESGYLMIGVDRIHYRAHRLAWKIITGNDPLFEIDHYDLNRSNCAFSNLREAERKQNARNRIHYKNNKLGIKGVSFNKKYKKFQVEIMKDRVKYNLGYYDNKEDAGNAYSTACKKLHGNFSRSTP